MKQETYKKLKVAWKVYEYTMYALVFTIGLIALVFGCVYLGRKACEPNIQEVSKQEPIKNSPRVAETNNTTYFKLFDVSYMNTDAYSEGIYSFLGSLYPDIAYHYDIYTTGSFYFYNNAVGYVESLNYISVELDYYTNDNTEGWCLSYVRLMPVYSTIITFDFTEADTIDNWSYGLNSQYVNDLCYYTGDLYFNDSSYDAYALFSVIFDITYSHENSSEFNFTSDYNFATLTSEVVTSERLIIPFNNQFNGSPTDEFIEFYIKADFVSNNVLYKGILFILDKPIYIYKDGLQQVNFRGSLSQLMVKQVYYMKSLPAHMPYENYPLEFSISNDCDLVANKHIVRYESYDDGQAERQVPVYDYRQYDWVNQTYRLVYFSNTSYNSTYYPVFYPTDNTMWSNRLYLGLTLYQVLNNGYYDYNYKTNTYVDGGANDLSQAFTLLAGAFGGLTSLMYIQVLPGISLGLLFFVPLIVTIIIVVLKLVKK